MTTSPSRLLSLFAALFLAAEVPAAADTLSEGFTFTLYNTGQKQYLSASDDGTLTLSATPFAFILTNADDTAAPSGTFGVAAARGMQPVGSSLLHAPALGAAEAATEWRFTPVAGTADTYTISNRYRDAGADYYLTFSTAEEAVAVQPLNPGAAFADAQWQMSETDVKPSLPVLLSEDAADYSVPDLPYGREAYVYLHRTLTLGEYNSFCVPFSISEEQLKEQFGTDMQLIEFTSFSDNTITFDAVSGGVQAGKPYHLRPTKAPAVTYGGKVCYVFQGVSSFASAPQPVSHGTDGSATVTFHASFSSATAPAKAYVIRRGDIYHLTADMPMKGFRGYFTAEGSGKSTVEGWKINGSAAGIGSVTSGAGTPGMLFNTAGQAVRSSATNADGLPHGIYVTKGKKVQH